MRDLAERIRDHYDSIATPVTVDEIIGDRRGAPPVRLPGSSVDHSVEPIEAQADGPRGDELMVDYLQQRPDEGTAGSQPKNRFAYLGAVAATILAVVGVAVVVGGDHRDNLVTFSSSIQWSRVDPDEAVFGGEGFQAMNSVTMGGPGLVAVGRDGSDVGGGDAAVWTSVDGITWSRVPHDEGVFGGAGGQESMNSVTHGGPGLVAVGREGPGVSGDAAVWTSVDGITWSRVRPDEVVLDGIPGGGEVMNDVTAGGPGLVAVGASGYISGRASGNNTAGVWTSVDGITWSQVPDLDAVFGAANLVSVTAGGPGLVAIGTDSLDTAQGVAGSAVWTSVDGITWSQVPGDVLPGHVSSVTAGGQGLVAVGWEGEVDTDAAVWTSVDGITWSQVPRSEAVFGGEGPQGMESVTAAGSGLVAVGWDGTGTEADAAVWTSVDGITWSRLSLDEVALGGEGQRMTSVTAAGSSLVAVGWDLSGSDVDAAVWVAPLEN